MTTPDAAALGRMTDAVFAVDEDWRFTFLNERGREVVCEAAGREATVEELEGANLWEVVPDAVDTAFYERYHEAMATQEVVAFEAEYAPLETWFEVRAYPDDAGLSVYFRDVTERREHERTLQRREDVLEQTYRVIANKEASFEEKVDTLLSIGREVLDTDYGALSRVDGDDYVYEIVHDPDGETHPGDVVPLGETNCERAIVTEETLVLEDVAADAPDLAERTGFTEDGIQCYVGTPVVVDDAVHGTFCFYDRSPRTEAFSDWQVTLVELMGNWVSYEQERVRNEAALTRERDRLDAFAGIVSHDLKNPMSVVSGRIDLARKERDSEHLREAASALDRMDDIVDDVLDLARVGRDDLDREALSLGAVAERAWTTVGHDGTLDVVDDVTVEADAGRLRQIFENLLGNACEHAGPEVTVRVGATARGFYVADDGPGIPPEARETVFEPGHSGGDGTGYGLYIVRTVAEAHGWDVAVTDAEGGGARFEVTDVGVT
jgi:signal transduction histidine kinase